MKREPPKILIRKADVCPHCREFNSIRIDHAFRQVGAFRVAYGFCRRCDGRVVVREHVSLSEIPA
jgi:hypothetical protein